jgi:hypothetical protein
MNLLCNNSSPGLMVPRTDTEILDTKFDWLCDVAEQFIRKIIVGNMCVCTIPKTAWAERVGEADRNVFLHTGFREWVWLVDRNKYDVDIEGAMKSVWIGEICAMKDVLRNTTLKSTITKEDKQSLKYLVRLPTVKVLYARCDLSMKLLDDIHRKYVFENSIKHNEIFAIKSVAGSGKTTTLLNIAKKQTGTNILYLAFNKSLITEVKDKIRGDNIKNMFPLTFDALMYRLYASVKGSVGNIIDIKPYSIGSICSAMINKSFKVKSYYCDIFSRFCSDVLYDDIDDFCLHTLGQTDQILKEMWDDCLDDVFVTFETIRKQAYIFGWCKSYVTAHFDMIMIDETQDFDMIMLKMLLRDTCIPKMFVGDPKQAIYQFRGCVNAFEYLPPETTLIEFYSTFRIGNPACNIISRNIPNCHMISKSNIETQFVESFDKHGEYTYLFRTWRALFKAAVTTPCVWIYSFEKKKKEIIALHTKLTTFSKFEPQTNSDDDLPVFLKSLSAYELNQLIKSIENNSVDFEESKIKMYTIHSYKGLEADNIRISGDVSLTDHENLYYVAITRGMKKIMVDAPTTDNMKISKAKTKDTKISLKACNAKDFELESDIKGWRKTTADALRIGLGYVISNNTIDHIIMSRPTNKSELLLIPGIGTAKLDKFGEAILRMCNKLN